MIRSVFLILWVVVSTTVLGIVAICVSFFTRTGNPVHFIARTWAKSILFVSRIKVNPGGVRMEIKEAIDTEKYTRKTKDALIERVRHVMREASKQASGEEISP